MSLGNAYEYRVFREGLAESAYFRAEHGHGGAQRAADRNRGKVILLVDETLASQITAGVQHLTQDLVGDGVDGDSP